MERAPAGEDAASAQAWGTRQALPPPPRAKADPPPASPGRDLARFSAPLIPTLDPKERRPRGRVEGPGDSPGVTRSPLEAAGPVQRAWLTGCGLRAPQRPLDLLGLSSSSARSRRSRGPLPVRDSNRRFSFWTTAGSLHFLGLGKGFGVGYTEGWWVR